jgi:hypothetical protein
VFPVDQVVEGTDAGEGAVGTIHSVRYFDGNLQFVTIIENHSNVEAYISVEEYVSAGQQLLNSVANPVRPTIVNANIDVFENAPEDGGTGYGHLWADGIGVTEFQVAVPPAGPAGPASVTTPEQSPPGEIPIVDDFQDDEGYTYAVRAAMTIANPEVSIELAPPGFADVLADVNVTGYLTNTTSGRTTDNVEDIVLSLLTLVPEAPTTTDDGCHESELDPIDTWCHAVPLWWFDVGPIPADQSIDLTAYYRVEFRVAETDAQGFADLIEAGDTAAWLAAVMLEVKGEVTYPDLRVIFDPTGKILAECPPEYHCL